MIGRRWIRRIYAIGLVLAVLSLFGAVEKIAPDYVTYVNYGVAAILIYLAVKLLQEEII